MLRKIWDGLKIVVGYFFLALMAIASTALMGYVVYIVLTNDSPWAEDRIGISAPFC